MERRAPSDNLLWAFLGYKNKRNLLLLKNRPGYNRGTGVAQTKKRTGLTNGE
jgi:hypothetical protein